MQLPLLPLKAGPVRQDRTLGIFLHFLKAETGQENVLVENSFTFPPLLRFSFFGLSL